MNESAIMVEAVRATQQAQQLQDVQQVQQVPDAAAVQGFQAAMAADAPQAVPLAEHVGEAWTAAQDNYQTLLHRITALTDMRRAGGPTVLEMSELQYDVQNLAFLQEIVTNVAKKASDAVQTLIKNG